tara:strand:+ start:72 stop:428 length:357 start_codon:yes stop_codon:yes gene_type:complete
MAGPAIPIIVILSAIAKIGFKQATKKYGKSAVDQAKKLHKKNQKTLDADHEDANYSTSQSRGKVTRTANSLSKSIRESLGPNADVRDNIKLRTLLQDLDKGGFAKGGLIDYRKSGLFK